MPAARPASRTALTAMQRSRQAQRRQAQSRIGQGQSKSTSASAVRRNRPQAKSAKKKPQTPGKNERTRAPLTISPFLERAPDRASACPRESERLHVAARWPAASPRPAPRCAPRSSPPARRGRIRVVLERHLERQRQTPPNSLPTYFDASFSASVWYIAGFVAVHMPGKSGLACLKHVDETPTAPSRLAIR